MLHEKLVAGEFLLTMWFLEMHIIFREQA